jgi:hypothetical protein
VNATVGYYVTEKYALLITWQMFIFRENCMGKSLKYKNNWIQHVNRMQNERIPKLLKKLPGGRKNRGQPMKRLLDDEAGAGQ